MSESVKIVIIDGKRNKSIENEATAETGDFLKVTHRLGATLMSTLLENHLISGNFCGGRGVCARCRVQFMEAAPIPTSMERRAFSPEELRDGFRLACMVKPKNDCVIKLAFSEEPDLDIVTDMIAVSEENDLNSQTQIGEDTKMIAVDLGTTTIAMQLMDMQTGHVEDTYCAMNPQRSYGADVLSRIQAANAGCAEKLRDSVWKVLQSGVEKFYQTSAHICCMCIAGNTTMTHLLMGLSTRRLGRAPFEPEDIGLQKCTLSDKLSGFLSESPLPVYVLPGISAFVGGDIVAGLYQCRMLAEWAEHPQRRETVLFIDLGTNGEMAISDGTRMIVTAAAAGPAFEGGAGAAVQGSDMVAVTAGLLEKHIIDESGLLAEPYFEQGITFHCPSGSIEAGDTTSGTGQKQAIYLTQKDIRGLQMAKAAVRAGVEILWKKMGRPVISRVCLAGGFGYYLDVRSAIVTGLLPERLQDVVTAVGNTSLAGAFLLGRDLYTGRISESALQKCLHEIKSINLAAEADFEALYLEHMNF
ncbi:MAG: ASKHA domain-containing protein [Ruminococcus sp.]|nr:ASKHA domain-containing protein [Ruminococcus sp.]